MIYDLQKASLTKRFSAFLFDFIILMVVFTGCMVVISSIVGFDSYSNSRDDRTAEICDKYIDESDDMEKAREEFNAGFWDYQYMTEEERAELPEELQAKFAACTEELNNDAELIRLYEIVMSLSLTILSLSLLTSFLALEFVVPLFLKNGQTIGKKIFSVAIMRTDGIAISPFVLFVRAILGKYTIGTMVPLLMVLAIMFGGAPIMPLTILLLILLLQVVLMITSRTNSMIHDYLASTVAVDMQSQMIFDSVEAKNAYILRIHSEDMENNHEN